MILYSIIDTTNYDNSYQNVQSLSDYIIHIDYLYTYI